MFFYSPQDAILSEMTAIDIEEHHHWIAQMEFLPEMFKAIENNVKILSRICVSLVEEKKQQRKKISKGALRHWKQILLFLKNSFIKVQFKYHKTHIC